jgi:RNA polymerase sigma-70 factor (ECF subfamily)
MATNEDRSEQLSRMAREHATVLYRVAHSVLRHPEDAEDAVQDVLLKLARARELPPMASERAYLARAVWRAALDRKSARREAQPDDGAELRVMDTRPGPADRAVDGDERALLALWIDELPGDLREALVLSALEGLNSREVSEVLGVPEGTVRTRTLRARNALRERWEQMQARGRRLEVAAAERRSR